MNYRMGVDLGTASLALAAVSLDNDGQPVDLIWHKVRIFDEPNTPGSKGQLVSKAATRRNARQQRRQIDRRLGRSKRIAALAPLLGVTAQGSENVGHRLPRLRALATRERIEKEGAKLREVEGGSKALQEEMGQLATVRGVAEGTLAALREVATGGVTAGG